MGSANLNQILGRKEVSSPRVSDIYRWISLTTIIRLSGHILVYMLHWSCAIHQKLYCCYIVDVPFAQKLYCYYIVIVSFTKKFIVVTLELCHSPKIVMLLHRRGSRVCWEWTGTMKNCKNTDFAGNSPKNAHF